MKKRAEAEGRGLRRRTKRGLEMREYQCLDTDLKLSSFFIGTCSRISIKRSSLDATLTAEAITGEDSGPGSCNETGESC